MAAAAVPWTILAFGALLRLIWYFDRGSLWHDEAMLSLVIVHRSPTELLEELDFAQGAPWGYLLAEKLSVATFGVDELSLRLVPLLAALAALPVFWRVASFYLEGWALLLSLLLFALSPQLVLYSAERSSTRLTRSRRFSRSGCSTPPGSFRIGAARSASASAARRCFGSRTRR
jgi:hypothetical protein